MENEEILGNDGPADYSGEEIIGGPDQDSGRSGGSTPPKEEPGANQAGLSLDEAITAATRAGGLKTLNDDYRQRKVKGTEMLWEHLRYEENPFKVLFLDYKLHQLITPEIVESNYNLLSASWQEVNNQLEGINRAKVTLRYGEEFLPELKAAPKTLKKAFDQIRTQEAIHKWFFDLNKERRRKGTEAIKELFYHDVKRGTLYKDDAVELIEKGQKYDLTEEEVRGFIYNELIIIGFSERAETILPDFLDNHWMSDKAYEESRARKTIEHKVLGQSISTVQQIGEVLFNQAERAKNEYINSVAYLPGVVSLLEGSDSSGRVYEKIINEERDINIRYLKIIYQLNPKLPFRIGTREFSTVASIFSATRQDKDLFLKVNDSFNLGHLQIWIRASDRVRAEMLTTDIRYVAFLKFLLRVDASHPVMLHSEFFDTPLQLINKAKNDQSYRFKISDSMSNGILPAWFESIGKSGWNSAYNTAIEPVINSAWHTDEDKKLASVQTLIRIIDPSVPVPSLLAETKEVELLSIDASKGYSQKAAVKLQETGFVKARVYFDQRVDGIDLQYETLTFNSLSGNPLQELVVLVNPLKLVKDRIYKVNVVVESLYQTITIPFTIKVVFPAAAYIGYLVKYGAFGIPFFFLIRVLLMAFTSDSRDYFPYIPTFNSFWNNLPGNQYAYVFVFLLMLAGIWGAFRLTKIKEKI